MKTVILGYMGSGKSTVAKRLAETLKLPFLDLDDYIEKQEESTIKDIFKNKGEIYFRLQESKYLQEVLDDQHPGIIALGGGTPCYGNNMDLITANANSFYLKGSISTIADRLRAEKSQRPLIASLNDEQLTEFIAKHLFERRDYYEKATKTINIDGKSVEDLSNELLTELKAG